LLNSVILNYKYGFMDKKVKLSILSIFLAAALVGSVVAYGDNMAYAGGDSHHKKKQSNDMAQFIGQDARTGESSSCGSENNTIAGCNNLDFTLNLNGGNSAGGQQ
jgi:hypothetical protein